MLLPLGLLPALTVVLVGYAARPVAPAAGALRLALVRAAVICRAGAALLVEALSALGALTTPWLLITWSAAVVPAAGAAFRRYRRDGRLPSVELGRWRKLGRGERILVLALAGLVLAELVVALVAPPNN